MTPVSDDPQAKMMQQMSLMMTFMFGFFTLSVPAGLTLYWVTSNLLQMLQQWAFTRTGLTPTATPALATAGNGESKAKVTNDSNGGAAQSDKTAKTTVKGNVGKSKRK